jgi:HEAT repeat protein
MLKDEKIYNKIWGMLISSFIDDRLMGIRAMAALGTVDAQNSIITMLDDDVDSVKMCAAYEMGKFKSKIGEPEVLGYFSKNSAKLNSLKSGPDSHLAIMAIGTIKSQKLYEYLPKLLDNPKKDLKLAAAQSLLMNVR